MKKLLLLALGLAFLQACKKKDEQPNGICGTNNGNVVLLKVDYQTHQFEGGKIFHLNTPLCDSIPINVLYDSPGDFGNVTLQLGSAANKIFDGTIVWGGSGAMNYPVLEPVAAFPAINLTTAAPDSAAIQYVNKAMYPVQTPSQTDALWSSISHLGITKEYMDAQGLVGLFLYTPGVGIGNPAEWDYFWILYKRTVVY